MVEGCIGVQAFLLRCISGALNAPSYPCADQATDRRPADAEVRVAVSLFAQNGRIGRNGS